VTSPIVCLNDKSLPSLWGGGEGGGAVRGLRGGNEGFWNEWNRVGEECEGVAYTMAHTTE
jgi:hypothetical protein